MNTLLLLGGLVLLGWFVLFGILRIMLRIKDCVDDELTSVETVKITNDRNKQSFFRFMIAIVLRKAEKYNRYLKELLINGKSTENVRIEFEPQVGKTTATDQTQTFISRVNGSPLPTIVWAKGGVEEKLGFNTINNAHSNASTGLNGKSMLLSLHIKDAQPADSGTYSCIARNPYGSASTQTFLRVLDKNFEGYNADGTIGNHCKPNSLMDPKVSLDKSGSMPIPPNFTEHWPSRIDALKGTDVRLDCYVY